MNTGKKTEKKKEHAKITAEKIQNGWNIVMEKQKETPNTPGSPTGPVGGDGKKNDTTEAKQNNPNKGGTNTNPNKNTTTGDNKEEKEKDVVQAGAAAKDVP